MRRQRDDSGAAVVEFVLVSVMLLSLLMGVIQVGIYLHVRNVVSAAAAEGARVAANADRDASDGVATTETLVAQGLSQEVADSLECGAGGDVVEGRDVIVMNCTVSVPLVFGLLGSLPAPEVSARAMKEG